MTNLALTQLRKGRRMASSALAPDVDSTVWTVILANIGMVELGALKFRWRLEAEGFDIRLDTDGEHVLVGPVDRLTFADRPDLVRHRADVLALVKACERMR